MAIAWTGAGVAATPPATLQLDKPEQRRLHVLTQRPLMDAAVLLPAQIVADPRQRWRTMPDQPGYLEAPAGGFPLAGKPVVAGQVLAWLRPTLSDPERRDLQSQRALSQQDFDIASLQIKRFNIDVALANTVSLQTPAIQVIADYKDAETRNGVLDQALNDRVPLIAPADGLLLTSLAQTQRVAVVGEPLFEGVSAAAFGVELPYSDHTLSAAAATRALVDADSDGNGGQELKLQYLGEAFDPATRSWRALYAIGSRQSLLVGQNVRVSVPRQQPRMRLPRASVFAANGQSWVWVHDAAERFVAQAVTSGAADAGWLEIRDGLDGNERVVVDAASLSRKVASR